MFESNNVTYAEFPFSLSKTGKKNKNGIPFLTLFDMIPYNNDNAQMYLDNWFFNPLTWNNNILFIE